MIGNSYEQDVLVPSKLGIKTIWITHQGYEVPGKNMATKMLSIDDLGQLPEITGELSEFC